MKDKKHISLETGHIYGCNKPFGGFGLHSDLNDIHDENFVFEMELGKDIQDFLDNKGYPLSRYWFHDDIIPKIKQKISTDSWRWQLFMNRMKQRVVDFLSTQSIEPGNISQKVKLNIQNEYDLIETALNISIPEIIDGVSNSNTWTYDEEKRMLRGPGIKSGKKRKQQRIRIMGYRDYTDIPSCEVLDYTFYKKRISQSNPTITLIHENMRKQQQKVKTLFGLTGNLPEIIVLFHNGEKIMSGDYWGNGENQQLLNEIIENFMTKQ